MLWNLLLSLAAAPVPVPQQIWTVDDDGPADFTSIAAAIPQVSSGDVLLVQPGTYGSFNLDKSLSILAPAGAERPLLQGMNKVSGAAECSFVRLRMEGLEVSSVQGRVAIDDCEIGPPVQAYVALTVQQCGQALVTRTNVKGPTAYAYVSSSEGSPFCAVHIIDTEAAFVACNLVGGNGPSVDEYVWDSQGGTGLRAQASVVTLAGTSANGGHGAEACGMIFCFFCSSGCAGPGGHAIWAETSDLTVRGNSSHTLIGGGSVSTAGWPDAKSIRAVLSQVIVSGVSLPSGIESIDSTVITATAEEPFLRVAGDDATGLRRILVFGSAGEPALVTLSFVPALITLADLAEGSLWLDPLQILTVVPLILQGQDHAASLLIEIPAMPELTGLTAVTQALCPNFPGTLDPSLPLLTNAGQLVLH